MARPDPVIHSPDAASRAKVIRALYAAGITCLGYEVDRCVNELSSPHVLRHYPYVFVRGGNIDIAGRLCGSLTPVNSVQQIITYLRKPHG